RGPELHAELERMAERAALLQPRPGQDQQDHGDPHPADIGLHVQGHAEEVAEQGAEQGADGQQGHAEDGHALILPRAPRRLGLRASTRSDGAWRRRWPGFARPANRGALPRPAFPAQMPSQQQGEARMRTIVAGIVAACALGGAALAAEPACQTLTPALIGGPVPSASSDTAVLRWLGTANYEVAYKGKVFLFDTYYDRPGRTRPIGFKVDQVKRADVIFIGHAHSDHISDVAAVAKQT